MENGAMMDLAGLLPTEEIDQKSIRDAIAQILVAIGEDPDREGLRETPHRGKDRMYVELLEGYRQDPAILANDALFEKPMTRW